MINFIRNLLKAIFSVQSPSKSWMDQYDYYEDKEIR